MAPCAYALPAHCVASCFHCYAKSSHFLLDQSCIQEEGYCNLSRDQLKIQFAVLIALKQESE